MSLLECSSSLLSLSVQFCLSLQFIFLRVCLSQPNKVVHTLPPARWHFVRVASV